MKTFYKILYIVLFPILLIKLFLTETLIGGILLIVSGLCAPVFLIIGILYLFIGNPPIHPNDKDFVFAMGVIGVIISIICSPLMYCVFEFIGNKIDNLFEFLKIKIK